MWGKAPWRCHVVRNPGSASKKIFQLRPQCHSQSTDPQKLCDRISGRCLGWLHFGVTCYVATDTLDTSCPDSISHCSVPVPHQEALTCPRQLCLHSFFPIHIQEFWGWRFSDIKNVYACMKTSQWNLLFFTIKYANRMLKNKRGMKNVYSPDGYEYLTKCIRLPY
jgi:hypothetical protein